MNGVCTTHTEFKMNDTCFRSFDFSSYSLVCHFSYLKYDKLYIIPENILFTLNATTCTHTHITHSHLSTWNTQPLCCFPFVLKFNQPIFMCIFCGRIKA